MLLCCPGLPVQRFYAHFTHQPTNMLSTNLKAFLAQHVAKHAGTCERITQMQAVYSIHQLLIGLTHWPREIVNAATTNSDGLRLAGD